MLVEDVPELLEGESPKNPFGFAMVDLNRTFSPSLSVLSGSRKASS